MKSKFLAIIVAATFTLAGCGTTPITPGQISSVTAQVISDVQAGAAAACKVIPTVAAILSIFNSGIGQTVATITAAVCAVAPAPASARFGALPVANSGAAPVILGITPNGIVVSGWRAGSVRFGHRHHG